MPCVGFGPSSPHSPGQNRREMQRSCGNTRWKEDLRPETPQSTIQQPDWQIAPNELWERATRQSSFTKLSERLHRVSATNATAAAAPATHCMERIWSW